MNTELNQTQIILRSMVTALEATVLTLPQQGDTEETCQRTGALNALSVMDEFIGRMTDKDLLESEYNLASTKGCISTTALQQIDMVKKTILDNACEPADNEYFTITLQEKSPKIFYINGTPINPTLFSSKLSEYFILDRKTHISALEAYITESFPSHERTRAQLELNYFNTCDSEYLFCSTNTKEIVCFNKDPQRFNAIAKIILTLNEGLQ